MTHTNVLTCWQNYSSEVLGQGGVYAEGLRRTAFEIFRFPRCPTTLVTKHIYTCCPPAIDPSRPAPILEPKANVSKGDATRANFPQT
eukprot:9476524-Pyramimonas_sp.AAC.1